MLGPLPPRATIIEVGPRDGLQSEPDVVPTADKIALVDRLGAAGYAHVEVTSFVNPRWVPQLADATEVMARVKRVPGVTYSALVPNMRGLEAALAANVDEVVVFAAASESFSLKNTNRGINDSLRAYGEVIAASLAAGKRVRAYASTVWGCPYEGPVDPARVEDVVRELIAMGAYQVSLGDTVGVATPFAVQRMVERLRKHLEEPQLALHFHDTRGMGLANVLAGLDAGITTYDASLGGLGGCPYAPGATGNVATEDVLYMCQELGVATGVDLEAVVDASRHMAKVLGRALPGRYLRAHLAKAGLLA